MIFRKTYITEKLPSKTDSYITNLGWNHFSEYRKQWTNDGNIEQGKMTWWMEEIKLPSDEDIKNEYSYGMRVTASYQQRMDDMRKGAKWMRDFVLAVTAKDNVR